MKKLLALIPLASLHLAVAQVRDYDPSVQPVDRIQYFKPAESHLFVGDCMPFDYRGTFYHYWLIDEGHHAGLGGLGGHQWALSTSEDMVHWKHYPVALGIDNDWEKSICTGSVIDVDSAVYAFYSTRVKDDAGVHEQLSFAVSHDGGFNFEKQTPNPFFITPERYESRNFRDPKVFRGEDGAYHMFASRWPKDLGFGANWLFNCEIVRASSKNPEGPYTFQEVVLGRRGRTFFDGMNVHNPYIRKWNQTYYLYYMGTTFGGPIPGPGDEVDSSRFTEVWNRKRIGLATAPSVFGPWTRCDEPLISPRDCSHWDCTATTNPAVAIQPDGTTYMLYKSRSFANGPLKIGVAKAPRQSGP